MKERLLFVLYWKRILLPLVAIISLFFFSSELHSQPYLRYFENGKVGYIDTTGKVVIKAKFAQAGDFSEGLAPARLEGLYGFIDEKGNYVIPPKYDYAMEFHEGFAIVYRDSVPCYIDKSGNTPFATNYQALFNFRNGFAKTIRYDGKYDLIDNHGSVILNGLKFDWPLTDSIIIVDDFVTNSLLESPYLVNLRGETVLPRGIYCRLGRFSEGFAGVEYKCDSLYSTRCWGFINRKYELVLNHDHRYRPSSGFHEGLMSVRLMKNYKLPPHLINMESNFYCGYINTAGNLVFSDTNFKSCGAFSNGKALLYHSKEAVEIDRNFNHIRTFNSPIVGNYNGYRLLRDSSRWWHIEDSAGGLVSRLNYSMVDEDMFSADGIFIYLKDVNQPYFGFINYKGEVLSEPKYSQVDIRRLYRNIYPVTSDGRRGYVNASGKEIWFENKAAVNDTLNIDFIPQVSNVFEYGMYETGKFKMDFDDDKYGLIVDFKTPAKYYDRPARNVYLYNTTAFDITTATTGCVALFTCQALSPDGIWRNIEKEEHSFCGNAYESMFTLRKGCAIKSPMSIYKGSFKTKLRYVFELKEQTTMKVVKSVYSDEFNGSVNPGQFWRYVRHEKDEELGTHDYFVNFYKIPGN